MFRTRRSRHRRVGETHQPQTVCGGFHLPYRWLTGARVQYINLQLR